MLMARAHTRTVRVDRRKDTEVPSEKPANALRKLGNEQLVDQWGWVWHTQVGRARVGIEVRHVTGHHSTFPI